MPTSWQTHSFIIFAHNLFGFLNFSLRSKLGLPEGEFIDRVLRPRNERFRFPVISREESGTGRVKSSTIYLRLRKKKKNPERGWEGAAALRRQDQARRNQLWGKEKVEAGLMNEGNSAEPSLRTSPRNGVSGGKPRSPRPAARGGRLCL